MTLDAPTMTPVERDGRTRIAPFLAPALVLLVVYALAGTWSVGQTFGGSSDDGWVDFEGRPTSVAPVTVDVVGHPALWVQLLIVAILVATRIWAARSDGLSAHRRRAVGIATATVFLVVVVLVFTVLQMHLIGDAFSHGDPNPPILGNVIVTRAHLPPE